MEAIGIAALGIAATCVGGLIWIIKKMFSRVLPAIDKIHTSLDRLAKATDKNTQATKSADQYLRERNGRDSAFWQEVRDSLHVIIGKKSAALSIGKKTIAKKKV